MGMSSSQARLLNLTGRMHQIEYKAAKLEAQKLQMANESRRVYDNYLQALDARKVQFATLTAKGSVDYADATLAGLENSIVHDTEILTSTKAYLLQNARTNEVYLTSKVAEALGFDTDFPESKEAYLELHSADIPKVEVTNTVPDYSNIISVTPVENEEPTLGTHSVTTYSYSMDMAQIAAIPAAQNTTTYTPSGSVAAPTNVTFPRTITTHFINEVTMKEAVPSGYTGIYSVDDLVNYFSAGNTSYSNYILMNDINLSDYITANGWTGLNGASVTCCTFDGNGHKITGLRGGSGLFTSLDDCEIKNLAIENAYLNPSGMDVGILTNNATSLTITNCYVKGKINATGDPAIGGFVGNNDNTVGNGELIIRNSYSDVTLSSGGSIGGFVGINSSGTMILDNSFTNYNEPQGFASTGAIEEEPGSHNDWGIDVSSVYNTQTRTVKGIVDGAYAPEDIKKYFAYKMYISEDNTNHKSYDECYDSFTWCDIQSNPDYCYISLSRVIGTGYENSYIRMMLQNGTHYGEREYMPHTHDIINQKPEGQFNVTPSYNVQGANRDDIVNSLAYGVYQAKLNAGTINNQTSIDSIKNTIDGFTDQQLVSLTQNPDQRATIIATLANTCSIAALRTAGINVDLYNGYTVSFDATPIAPLTSNTNTETVNDAAGTIKIPQTSEIASNLVVAFRKAGKTIDNESRVTTNLNNKVASNYIYLADLNDYIAKYLKGENDGSKMVSLYNYIMGSGSQVTLPASFDHSTYVPTQVNKGVCNVQYGTKSEGTGVYIMDVNSAEYARYSAEYDNLVELRGTDLTFKIIDDDLANSTEYLNTLLDNDSFVLIDFSKGLGEDMTHTNISVETNLQEVSDETELRKAEAQYEADMRKIDAKDRKYDVELAALDNERNAIKSEMETLKTVVKENVERTFKLFG